PVQIYPCWVAPVGPLRFIPIDADDPFARGCVSRDLSEACQGVLHGPGPGEAGPSDLSRTVGHMGMRVDETRNHDTTMEIDATRLLAGTLCRLGRGPDVGQAHRSVATY